MARNTLPALPAPPFSFLMPEPLLERIDTALAEIQLAPCAYEYSESFPGACDGQPCCEKGTVHHRQLQQDFCFAHYQEVNRVR